MHLLAGEKEAVARWLKSSGWESFDPDSPGPIFNDESFFAFCQFIIASKLPHEWKRVERLLEWRLADCRRQRRQLAILQIHLAQAFLHHTRNHPDRASDSLLQALEVAWSENIVRPFLDEGRPLIPYLSRIPRQHQAWEFAQTIRVQISGIHDDSQPMIERLSEQEFCILQLMAQGHTNPEIARERVLAVSTVRWYARQIFRKLGVHNRTQATTQARKLNLL
jgi:Response regulator containing a CheY-like receiver domain and an HTH DNA-binding domain